MSDSQFTFRVGIFLKGHKRLSSGNCKCEAGFSFGQKTCGNDITVDWKVFYQVTKKIEAIEPIIVFFFAYIIDNSSWDVLKGKVNRVVQNTKFHIREKQ